MLLCYGVALSVYFNGMLTEITSSCEEKYGSCLWEGMYPKVHFSKGYFSERTCGEGKITTISANNCDLQSLPDSFGDSSIFPNLHSIDLSGNEVSSLPSSLLDRHDLTELTLDQVQ